jgi:hypothetical protein
LSIALWRFLNAFFRHDITGQQIDLRTKTSWLLELHEVQTPEVSDFLFFVHACTVLCLLLRRDAGQFSKVWARQNFDDISLERTRVYALRDAIKHVLRSCVETTRERSG